jgi:hypothetical protein
VLILICSGICTGLTHVVRATLSTAYGTSRRRWHCQCASLASLWLRPLALQAEDVQNDGVGTPTGWYVSATYLLAGALGTLRRYSLTGAVYGQVRDAHAHRIGRLARVEVRAALLSSL